MLTLRLMSGGSVDCSSSMRFTTAALTESTFACACGTMPMLIPVWLSVREKLRIFSGAISTSATSPSRTR